MTGRRLFRRRVRRFGAGRLVWVDEMAATTKLVRAYARSPRGRRAPGRVPGRWETLSVIAALGIDGPFAAAWLPGAYNGEKFLAWVTGGLCPRLKRRDVVVLDNVSFHHRRDVRAAIRARGADVRFLPPYSPDLNPIERMWSKVKALLRTAGPRTRAAVEAALPIAFAAVTPADAAGWINHSYPRILS